MTPTEHAEQAIHALCLARIAGNEAGVRCWQVRMDYWTERVMQENIIGSPL